MKTRLTMTAHGVPLTLCTLLALTLATYAGEAPAPYPGWQHTGSLLILTTPEGADLPASASEDGFPLLVRLDKDFFDFKQAKAHGEDIRFAAGTGEPLAYQIDEWDPAAGTASLWVRIPTIKGNAHQDIRMFWGKADATSESRGSAVFSESNGYVSVFHMSDPVQDAAGTVEARDEGTTPAAGMIGRGRHFSDNKSINGGTNIIAYPTGNSPHSSELWVRADRMGGGLLRWGVCKPHSIVQMGFSRPPKIVLDCFYSPAGIRNDGMLPLSQWIHVVYVFGPGEARLYINGRLDGLRTGQDVSLTIGSPAEMRIGGQAFSGDMDEVRISKVARSADWVRLQYENQKPLQTVVGTLAWPGTDFSVSEKRIDLLEGKSLLVTAKAGGARKVYWILKRGGSETIAEVDRLHFTLNAGRVTGDQSFTLQFKAVFADGVKTLDIPVTVREDIPDPLFALKAPTKWDGRQTIEVSPQISNLKEMQAKGVADLQYAWALSGLAVIKELQPGKLILRRSQNSGTVTVTATLSNGGKPTTQSIPIVVEEPPKDAWVQRTPDKDEKPVDNQFYARDDKNEGTLCYNGTLNEAADAVFLKVYADGKLIKTESRQPGADKSYALSAKLKPGLIKYKVEFGTKSGDTETVQHTVGNLVCGDAYIIDGQSNAVAYNYENNTQRPDLIDFTSDWIRSYGSGGEAGDDTTNGGWGNAVLTNLKVNNRGGVRFVGVWGMVLARKLLEDQKMPICILNGAVGGTRIDQHLPDPTDPLNSTDSAHTIYRNLMRRVVAARLTHGIRGVLWHQGEADQGYDGPDNCYGCETYQQYFIDLSAAWKRDYPNIQHYYLFQIWPNSCSQGGNRNSDMLRDVQRRLSRLYSNLSVMSTLSLPSGGCHFNLTDYERMGLSMARLVERDNYGTVFEKPVTAPDVKKAYFTNEKKDEIALEFDQPMAWSDALTSQFYLDGKEGKVASGAASGNVVKLKLAAAESAKAITYLVDKKWDIKNLLYGQNGIAALTFCEVPVLTDKLSP